MFKVERSFLLAGLCIWAVWGGSLHAADASSSGAAAPAGLEGVWDSARYIGLDEISPGMEAYCLTEYGVAGIEKFALRVIDVVRNVEPGRDAILVQGTDERFKQTGPVAGSWAS